MTGRLRQSGETDVTNSIVARNPGTGDLGMTIASRALAVGPLAVGAIAPFTRAGAPEAQPRAEGAG